MTGVVITVGGIRAGADIGGVASHKLVHRGINRTFQIPKPFLSLTVRQNIEVALAYGGAVDPPALDDLIDEYRLAELADRPAADRLPGAALLSRDHLPRSAAL